MQEPVPGHPSHRIQVHTLMREDGLEVRIKLDQGYRRNDVETVFLTWPAVYRRAQVHEMILRGQYPGAD